MRLDWRKSILYVTTLGTVGCWLYAIMAGANKQVADEQLSVIGLLLLYPISFAFNKLLQRLRWHRIWMRTVNWLAWAIAMLLMVGSSVGVQIGSSIFHKIHGDGIRKYFVVVVLAAMSLVVWKLVESFVG